MKSKYNRSVIITGKYHGETIRRLVQLLKEDKNYYSIIIENHLTDKEFEEQVANGTYSFDETIFRIVESEQKSAINSFNLIVRQLKKNILYVPCVWILDE